MEKPKTKKGLAIIVVVVYSLLLITDIYLTKQVFKYPSGVIRSLLEVSLCIQMAIYIYGWFLQLRNIFRK